ncbi:phenylacetate--CoA ligase family protein [Candidatus Poribacteria bacterium]|nr:phenylacetate--CoA ligase family protein [Candidatus Poribacteria bacterium]
MGPQRDLLVHAFKAAYGVVPYPLRAGFRDVVFSPRLACLYVEARRQFRAACTWNRDQTEAYQLDVLRSLLEHARQRVPFYRDLFRRHGWHADSFGSLDDLRRLPALDKVALSDDRMRFVADDCPPQRLTYMTTSGSTGIPFGFYLERGRTNVATLAHLHETWAQVGWTPRSRNVVLRGKFVGSAERGRYHAHDPLARELLLSSYHLSPQVIAEHFLPAMQRYRPEYLHAYPSAATILAQHVIETGQRPPPLRAALLASENLYDWQRRLVETAFGCPVVSWYGMAERAAFALQVDDPPGYCFHAAYGIAELLSPAGEPVTRHGDVGEIVVTGFHNRAMPFIRYRTGDLAALDTSETSQCPGFLRVSRIEGRLQELVVTSDGRHVSMTAVNMHNDLFDRVEQFQFEQVEPGKLSMRIARRPDYGEADERRICDEIGEKLAGIDIHIEYVESIPRSASGKHRFLIQRLPVRYSD